MTDVKNHNTIIPNGIEYSVDVSALAEVELADFLLKILVLGRERATKWELRQGKNCSIQAPKPSVGANRGELVYPGVGFRHLIVSDFRNLDPVDHFERRMRAKA